MSFDFILSTLARSKNKNNRQPKLNMSHSPWLNSFDGTSRKIIQFGLPSRIGDITAHNPKGKNHQIQSTRE